MGLIGESELVKGARRREKEESIGGRAKAVVESLVPFRPGQIIPKVRDHFFHNIVFRSVLR